MVVLAMKQRRRRRADGEQASEPINSAHSARKAMAKRHGGENARVVVTMNTAGRGGASRSR